MQWKQLDFPALIDPFNTLGAKVVPMTVAIDEHGVVRHVGITPDELEKEFLDRSFAAPTRNAKSEHLSAAVLRKTAEEENTSRAWMNFADALVLESGDEQLDAAISAYQSAIALDRTNGPAYFRVGVAYRMRYDKHDGAVEDFRSAVEHWGMALEVDPNQYIWRRRIQQYGPRLAKPYPFYDWVREARKEVIGRGERPARLRAEPRGAELAEPATKFEADSQTALEPDPRGQIERDRTLILIETAVVPAAVNPQDAVRVHMTLRVNRDEDTHWNNETGPMEIWISPPREWQTSPQLLRPKLPNVAQSSEVRHVEFELRSPRSADPGMTLVPGYALYYACRGKDGACLYRRQDFVISVNVRQKYPGN